MSNFKYQLYSIKEHVKNWQNVIFICIFYVDFPEKIGCVLVDKVGEVGKIRPPCGR